MYTMDLKKSFTQSGIFTQDLNGIWRKFEEISRFKHFWINFTQIFAKFLHISKIWKPEILHFESTQNLQNGNFGIRNENQGIST